jgi:hypothetical protein
MSTSPFFFFENLNFNATNLLTFADSIPEHNWINPLQVKAMLQNTTVDDPKILAWGDIQWWIASSKNNNIDFLSCEEVQRIANYFTIDGKPLFKDMAFKKTKKGFVQPFCPLMQNKQMDERNNVVRTFDIIFPLKGGFIESPIESLDTITNTIYTLDYTGQPYMVPTNPDWHYRWEETMVDYRYTFHLRGCLPVTYEEIKTIYKV